MTNRNIGLIVSTVLENKEGNYHLLHQAIEKTIYQTAYQYFNNHHDAEDAVQDISLIVYSKLETLKNPNSFNGWLKAIIMNYIAEQFRKKAPIPMNGTEEQLDKVEDKQSDQVKNFERTQRKELLLDYLSQLPSSFSNPLYLYYFQNLSIRQISTLLEIHPENIKARLFRGRKMLKKLLAKGKHHVGFWLDWTYVFIPVKILARNTAWPFVKGWHAVRSGKGTKTAGASAGAVLLALALIGGSAYAYHQRFPADSPPSATAGSVGSSTAGEAPPSGREEAPPAAESPGNPSATAITLARTAGNKGPQDTGTVVIVDPQLPTDPDKQPIVVDTGYFLQLPTLDRLVSRDLAAELETYRTRMFTEEVYLDLKDRVLASGGQVGVVEGVDQTILSVSRWNACATIVIEAQNKNKLHISSLTVGKIVEERVLPIDQASLTDPEWVLNQDLDHDGIAEVNLDVDGDGLPDLNIDLDRDGSPDLNVDLDRDGLPDMDIDTNGDLLPELNLRPRTAGTKGTDMDTDGDWIAEVNLDADKDGVPDSNLDTDGDWIPDVNLLP